MAFASYGSSRRTANARTALGAIIMLTIGRSARLVQMDNYEAQMVGPKKTALWLPTMALASVTTK
jgi:hypothetical protein